MTASLAIKALTQTVYDTLAGFGLQDKSLFVGCSGGRDSVLLAYACVLLYQQQKIKVPCLIHVNHHLQKDSDAWATLVGNFASKHGVLCATKHIYLDDDSENGARAGRYQALFEAIGDDGVLLLGHHLNDNSETVLMRLINGTSLHGLTGIPPYRLHKLPTKQIHICRPLLSLSRQEITTLAKKLHLPFVDDPTNTEGSARAIIRRLIPQLNELNPQAAANIHRTSRLLAQSEAILAPLVADTLQAVQVSEWAGNQIIAIDKLHTVAEPLQKAVLACFIKGDLLYNPNSNLVADVYTLCLRKNGDHQTLFYYDGYVICRYDDYLYRYCRAFWASLAGHSYADDTALVLDDRRFLLSDIVPCRLSCPLKKVSKTDKITYRHKTLSGKKVYQTLRVPVWLRRHLYVADDLLISFGRYWQLGYSNTVK